ncbi:hypothetical protein ABT354_24145 [Streptomyces sp. NPDC000594]|uniref:hypothetical protein n=1 Tax=Streptomyces sp. NPDC000594 TaxID=3154261 RepID=UPI00331D5808
MRKWFQNLSDTMVDRLVPKTEAAAAVQCWTEETCERLPGTVPLCRPDGWMTTIWSVCSDGTRTRTGWRCGRC